MKHYLTFEKTELGSTITTLGFNLHKVADDIVYFKQYAKIYGVEHDAVIDTAIGYINQSMKILNSEFNLPKENNCCLMSVSANNEEVIDRANKDHYNPYKTTIPRLQELVKSFLAIAEREGTDPNWEAIKVQCKTMP